MCPCACIYACMSTSPVTYDITRAVVRRMCSLATNCTNTVAPRFPLSAGTRTAVPYANTFVSCVCLYAGTRTALTYANTIAPCFLRFTGTDIASTCHEYT